MATLEEFQHRIGDKAKINKSRLFLQPKCQGANRVENFRPISLSNLIYHIIAMLLANRLRGVIGDSGAFPICIHLDGGGHLVDSAVVAGMIIISWQRKGTRGFMWKVNFTKAYNSLN